MRRTRKLKKVKLIIVIAVGLLLVSAIIAAIVININKPKEEKPREVIETEEKKIYSLPDTQFNGMQVTHVELEYLKPNNQTMVTMTIKNSTGTKTERKAFNVFFYDANNVELLNAGTVIEGLEPNVESSTSIILTGDFTSITRVELR